MRGPIMLGPIDSMCLSIRTIWSTITSHISMLFRHRSISFRSLIVRRLAFICAREYLMFSTSAFIASISSLFISIISWRFSTGWFLPR